MVQKVVVRSATDATEIALSFAKKHRVIARPVKAAREDDTWLVTLDVGAILVELGTVRIDANTGEIMQYEFPETGRRRWTEGKQKDT